MNKTIKDYSETELKAIAYDNLAQIEQCQLVIKAVNQELSLRKESLVAEPVVETVKEVSEQIGE